MTGTPEFFPASSLDIRNGTQARVAVETGFTNVWAQRALPAKDDQLPFAIIWHGGDRTEPWGDANVGSIRFDHTLKIIVVIAVSAETPDGLDPSIVDVTERVRAALLTDPTWINLFEACTKADVGYAFPGDGQTPYARGLIEFEVTYRSEWPPATPNDFQTMAITGLAGLSTQVITLPGDTP